MIAETLGQHPVAANLPLLVEYGAMIRTAGQAIADTILLLDNILANDMDQSEVRFLVEAAADLQRCLLVSLNPDVKPQMEASETGSAVAKIKER